MADSLPTPADSPHQTTTEEDHLALGIRYLSLFKYSEASEHLSYALEDSTKKNGELSFENVDCLILLGKALLGNAIQQSAVLGNNKVVQATTTTQAVEGGEVAASSSAAFHFSGDDEEEDGGDEEGQEEEEQDGDGDGDGEEEEADDFESAFQVLDIARRSIELALESLELEIKNNNINITEKEKEKIDKKSKLAQVHRLLGDVATESEQFDSAVLEYSSSLDILTQTLPRSDRHLSELHMLIALALEFTPNGLQRAISHAEKAKSVLVLRLRELEKKITNTSSENENGEEGEKDKKEVLDIKDLMGDVDNKIEDLKTVPTAPPLSTSSGTDLALESLLRQATGIGASSSLPVNDLNSLVKKKKKPTATATPTTKGGEDKDEAQPGEVGGKGKRKIEEVSTSEEIGTASEQQGGEKKVKTSPKGEREAGES